MYQHTCFPCVVVHSYKLSLWAAMGLGALFTSESPKPQILSPRPKNKAGSRFRGLGWGGGGGGGGGIGCRSNLPHTPPSPLFLRLWGFRAQRTLPHEPTQKHLSSPKALRFSLQRRFSRCPWCMPHVVGGFACVRVCVCWCWWGSDGLGHSETRSSCILCYFSFVGCRA